MHLLNAREYWDEDRDEDLERDLVNFAEAEFSEVFHVTEEEVGKVLDLLRAYVRHLNPEPEQEVKAFRFELRGDVVVVVVTEEE